MANIKTKNKQNPKLQQSVLSDGRASLYLEFYLGRTAPPSLIMTAIEGVAELPKTAEFNIC